jgi:hypothetical protein
MGIRRRRTSAAARRGTVCIALAGLVVTTACGDDAEPASAETGGAAEDGPTADAGDEDGASAHADEDSADGGFSPPSAVSRLR